MAVDERQFREALNKVPPELSEALLQGQTRIHKYERRKKVIRWAAIPMVFIVAACLSIIALGGREIEDKVAAGTVQYLAHPDDDYYHQSAQCPACLPEAVELPEQTALALNRLPCPICVEGSK